MPHVNPYFVIDIFIHLKTVENLDVKNTLVNILISLKTLRWHNRHVNRRNWRKLENPFMLSTHVLFHLRAFFSARLTHNSTKSKDVQSQNMSIFLRPSCSEKMEPLNIILSVWWIQSLTKVKNFQKQSYLEDSDQYFTPSSKNLAGHSSQNVPVRHSLTRFQNNKAQIIKASHLANNKTRIIHRLRKVQDVCYNI